MHALLSLLFFLFPSIRVQFGDMSLSSFEFISFEREMWCFDFFRTEFVFFLKKSFLLKKWLLLLMSHFLNKFQTISKICESLEKSAPKITCSLLVNKSFHKSSLIFNFIKKKENFHLFFLIIHKWWFEKLSNLRETCSKNHLSRSIRASSQVARLACVSSTS